MRPPKFSHILSEETKCTSLLYASLIVESSDKLSAGNKGPDYWIRQEAEVPRGGSDAQIETSHSMPELRYSHCSLGGRVERDGCKGYSMLSQVS